jgi:ferredoxin
METACGERRCPDCRMAVRGGFFQDLPFSWRRVPERVKKTVLTGNLLASSPAIV